MAVTSSMKELGWRASDFELPAANPGVDLGGKPTRTLADYADRTVLVVVFTCNHCPYAIHVEDELIRIAGDYDERGVQLVAICSNDAVRYPADNFEAMALRAEERAYPFPYLRDDTQAVARNFGAACTPDTFVLDRGRHLVYRGRIDETRPGGAKAHGGDLRAALESVLSGSVPPRDQHASIGCGIKWLPENGGHRS